MVNILEFVRRVNGFKVGGPGRPCKAIERPTSDVQSHFGQMKIFPNDPKLLPHSDFVPNFWKIIGP